MKKQRIRPNSAIRRLIPLAGLIKMRVVSLDRRHHFQTGRFRTDTATLRVAHGVSVRFSILTRVGTLPENMPVGNPLTD